MIFEVCVDSVAGVEAARRAGAQRVELCSGLVEGGLTPSFGLVQQACRQGMPVHVLVRPRGGDFLVTASEMEVMRQDILALKTLRVHGIVVGALLPDGTIDEDRLRNWVSLARPLSVTFHRAFDLCRDPYEGLDVLMRLGIDRLLTSGQQPSALEGAECMARLVRQAGGKIAVMAGGGINAHNVAALARATGVPEVHFSARDSVPSQMRFQRSALPMGKPYQPDEYTLKNTNEDLIRAVIDAAAGA